MSKILLINLNQEYSSDINLKLYLHGYEVEVCESIEAGMDRFAIFKDSDRAFDLVLIVTSSDHIEQLEHLDDDCFFAKAVIVNERKRPITKRKFPVCEPKLIIDYIRCHFDEHTGNNSFANIKPRTLESLSGW